MFFDRFMSCKLHTFAERPKRRKRFGAATTIDYKERQLDDLAVVLLEAISNLRLKPMYSNCSRDKVCIAVQHVDCKQSTASEGATKMLLKRFALLLVAVLVLEPPLTQVA